MLLFIVNTFCMCKINNALAQYCGHSIRLTKRAQNLIFPSTKKHFKLKLKLWNIASSCLKCKYIRIILIIYIFLSTFGHIHLYDTRMRWAETKCIGWSNIWGACSKCNKSREGELIPNVSYPSYSLQCTSFFIVTSVIVLLRKNPSLARTILASTMCGLHMIHIVPSCVDQPVYSWWSGLLWLEYWKCFHWKYKNHGSLQLF